jgi:hypothetical protein
LKMNEFVKRVNGKWKSKLKQKLLH